MESTLLIYLPSFYNDIPLYTNEQCLHLQKEDWLTTDLKDEITTHFPKPDDIDKSTNAHNKDEFVIQAQALFPVGRIFASYKQLFQAANLFLDAWGANGTHAARSIHCGLGKSFNKKPIPSDYLDMDLKRRNRYSAKNDINCPFRLSYSLVKYYKPY